MKVTCLQGPLCDFPLPASHKVLIAFKGDFPVPTWQMFMLMYMYSMSCLARDPATLLLASHTGPSHLSAPCNFSLYSTYHLLVRTYFYQRVSVARPEYMVTHHIHGHTDTYMYITQPVILQDCQHALTIT